VEKTLRIGIFGCGSTTYELTRRLLASGIRITDCITIDAIEADKQSASGYIELLPKMSEIGISVHVMNSYSLKGEEDRRRVVDLNLDLAFCIGWQRLLPSWCLDSVRLGVFGMHGSFKPLPHGRGRSPLNWSLLLGKEIFYTHLFKYEEGVDSGPVLGVQSFDINSWDTAHTLHLKNLVSMSQLCIKYFDQIVNGSAELLEQPKEGISYYPKRNDDDGRIFWDDTSEDIHKLIRAVTHPFPGAWTYSRYPLEQRIRIWEACPFDSRIEWKESSLGEILEVFSDGTFVVKTGDGTLYVSNYDGKEITFDDVGLVLDSGPEQRKQYEDLPD